MTRLEQQGLGWIEPYWNAEHLRRTRDWLLELEPEASEELRLAALTHDMERHFPGGPVEDLTKAPEENFAYRRAHAERSGRFVRDWLEEEGAEAAFVDEVVRLVGLHEVGGDLAADLLQAADSLSFLEVNTDLPAQWAAEGRCSLERGLDQHRWMFERIRLERARSLAEPLYRRVMELAA